MTRPMITDEMKAKKPPCPRCWQVLGVVLVISALVGYLAGKPRLDTMVVIVLAVICFATADIIRAIAYKPEQDHANG